MPTTRPSVEEILNMPADAGRPRQYSSTAYCKVHTAFGSTGSRQGGESIVDAMARAYKNGQLQSISPECSPLIRPGEFFIGPK